MRYSQSQLAIASRLSPRKKPTQSRSAKTVETILEGAARILEEHGFEGYTTNKIAARAGVSIGSLYQYFRTRDAVTIALIERESVARAADVKAALLAPDWHHALLGMIESSGSASTSTPTIGEAVGFRGRPPLPRVAFIQQREFGAQGHR
jgi:AcrR family transcriptional regulator